MKEARRSIIVVTQIPLATEGAQAGHLLNVYRALRSFSKSFSVVRNEKARTFNCVCASHDIIMHSPYRP